MVNIQQIKYYGLASESHPLTIVVLLILRRRLKSDSNNLQSDAKNRTQTALVRGKNVDIPASRTATCVAETMNCHIIFVFSSYNQTYLF